KHKCFDIVVHNVGGTLGVKDTLSPMEKWYEVWRFNAGIAIEMNALDTTKLKKWIEYFRK
ncbi:MAG: hypothetical protein JKY48_08635, partial [Flavobacteriales bacterium]|nr:hypothetical protein [Flavobacteriales bacterium]